MILLGEKKEEYRAIKPYWDKRFFKKEWTESTFYFDKIIFTNGYGNHRPKIIIKCNGISHGPGKYEWGGSEKNYILKLGEILETRNNNYDKNAITNNA